MAEIVELLVSPVHRYDGRPGPHTPVFELVETVTVRAGLGLEGDRYFNRPAHRDAAVTVMSAEALEPWNALARPHRRPRRLEALRGHGGMRCEPLSDGVLRVGPVEVSLDRSAEG